jgi:hypothetical protein
VILDLGATPDAMLTAGWRLSIAQCRNLGDVVERQALLSHVFAKARARGRLAGVHWCELFDALNARRAALLAEHLTPETWRRHGASVATVDPGAL